MTKAQRDQLESWIFDENISYRAASRRCFAEFKIKVAFKAVWVFYQQTAKRRALQSIIHTAQATNAVSKTFDKNPAKTYEAVLKVIGQIAFNAATKSGEQVDVRTIRDLTALLISARHDEILSQRFALEREKWEFDCVRTVQAHFKDLLEIDRDKSLDEDARLLAIQRRLFGTKLPV